MMYDGPGIYRHYKGGIYCVQGLGRLEEDHHEARVVIYAPIDGWPEDVHPADFWIRPLRKFDEYVNGAPRFEKMTLTEIMAERNERLMEWAREHAKMEEWTGSAPGAMNVGGAPGECYGD